MLRFPRESTFRLEPPEGYEAVLDDPTATHEPNQTLPQEEVEAAVEDLLNDEVITRTHALFEVRLYTGDISDQTARDIFTALQTQNTFDLTPVPDESESVISSSQLLDGEEHIDEISSASAYIHARGTDEQPDLNDPIHIQKTWDPETELSKAA